MAGPFPDLVAFVREARVARLATADAEGRPHVIPICFAFDGEHLYTAIDAKPKRVPPERLARIRNITANRQVAVVVDEYDEDWGRLRYVMLQGTASILREGADHRRAVDLLREKYPQYRAMASFGEGLLVIRIAPTHWAGWRGGEQG